jgi:carbon storage regulator CsrA
MLVLTRKPGEKITIMCPDGNLIVISLCRVDHHYKVRIGIEAEENYKITRSELIEKSNLSTEEYFKSIPDKK